MSTSDHEKEREDHRFIRYHGSPNPDSTSGILEEFRVFLRTAAYMLLYFAAISIEEAHKTPAFIRERLKTLRVRLRIGRGIQIDFGHGSDCNAQGPIAEPGTDQIPSQQEPIQAALQDAVGAIEAIRQKDGAVGFPATSVHQQLDEAPHESPGDSTLTEMARKVAYRDLEDAARLLCRPDPGGWNDRSKLA